MISDEEYIQTIAEEYRTLTARFSLGGL